MIAEKTIDLVLGPIEILNHSNVSLVPKEGNILSSLCKLSLPQLEDQDNNTNIRMIAGITADTISSDADGCQVYPSQHTVAANSLIETLKTAVTQHVNFAKNVVKPLVLQYAENLKEVTLNFEAIDPSKDFNIVKLYIPSLLTDESFLDSIKVYEGKSAISPSITVDLPNYSYDQIVELLNTGNNRTNKLLQEWLVTLEPLELEKIWMSFFSPKNSIRSIGFYKYDFDSINQLNHYKKATVSLLVYLLAENLVENVKVEEAVSLDVYRNAMVQLRDWAGSVLFNTLIPLATYNKNNILIISNDQVRKTVEVNAEVYQAWLKSGGSPEIIFGLVVSGDNVSSQAMIDSKASVYQSKWKTHCAFNTVYNENKRFASLKNAIRTTFNTSLNDVTESEKEYRSSNQGALAYINKAVDEYLDTLTVKDLDNYIEISLNLVAKYRFFYTSAYRILSDIMDAGRANPNIDVREAALLAVIGYISDYFIDQITVVKV